MEKFEFILFFSGNVITGFNAFAVEGVVASLRTRRNCIALGSAALKLYAQRRIMARLREEEREEDESEVDTS